MKCESCGKEYKTDAEIRELKVLTYQFAKPISVYMRMWACVTSDKLEMERGDYFKINVDKFIYLFYNSFLRSWR